MVEKELRKKVLKAYKNAAVFGEPEVHGYWYYYWLLFGNRKKIVMWNIKTDEHEVIVDAD